MNWPEIITSLQARGLSLREIASKCGFASAGALHDLQAQRQKTCSFERATALLNLHRRQKPRKK